MTEQTKERIEQLSSKLSGDCHNNSKSINLGTVVYKHAKVYVAFVTLS